MYVHLSNRCAGDHSLERRHGATTGHLDELHAAGDLEPFGGEMRGRALARGGGCDLAGLALAKAISSAMVRVGSRVLTTSRIGIVARIDTGTNALGSKLSFW